MKKWLLLGLLLPFFAHGKFTEVYWEDLVPQGFELPENQVSHQGQSMAQTQPDAPVVDKYDGMKVRIPGFVVPLEGDDETLTEFLLVPYFGACVHVPPPPSNQIVHVKFPKGAPVGELYDAVWISGTLSTKGWKGDIASVGYTMVGVKIETYD